MAKQTILDSKFTVKGGVVVIEEKVQRQFDREELDNERIGLFNRQSQINRQINDLSGEHKVLGDGIKKIELMIEALTTESQK